MTPAEGLLTGHLTLASQVSEPNYSMTAVASPSTRRRRREWSPT